MPGFDCFLSHNGRDKPAVRALKRALEPYGVRCWLDEEQLRPGLPWQSLLEQAIRACTSVAVCVAGDGIGPWEDEEMQAALRLAVRDPGRPVIPVLLPGAPQRPELPLFLGNRTWVDLRGVDLSGGIEGGPVHGGVSDPAARPSSVSGPGSALAPIARLVWGITGEHPAARPARTTADHGPTETAPVPSEARFIDEVFELLYSVPTLILLAQEDRELGGTLTALHARALCDYGAERVLHLAPPRHPQASEAEFFSTLGRRAGMDPLPDSAAAFESRLEARLAAGERLFLLVKGLAACSDRGRERLADCIQGLADFHGATLRVVLVGGEALAGLKFVNPEVSLLRHAEPRHWPEWSTGDLMDQARRAHPPVALDPDQALILLEATGGHPRLILDALRCRAKVQDMDRCLRALERAPHIEAQLVAFAGEPERRRKLAQWLAQPDLGPYRLWIDDDPALRQLYWMNLLRPDGPEGEERLVWRCPAVVRVGLRVLS